MTVIQAVRNLLDSPAWTPSVSGRPHDVPQPQFVEEKDQIQESLSARDVAYVRDGGDETWDVLGFGATEALIDYVVTVELRSTNRNRSDGYVDGQVRMFGERGAGSLGANESGRWPGLTGETKRVLTEESHRYKEFDVFAVGLRVKNNSDMMGPNSWRADVTVPLKELRELDTTT